MNRGPQPYLGHSQACGTHGHNVQRCPSFRVVASDVSNHNPQQSQRRHMANTTYLNNNHPDAWLMDSGASHHVTADMSNFASHSSYT